MNTYYSDPAQPLRFVIRVNRVNEFVFSFIQDSLPWQIGYNEFEFLVKRYAGERSNLLRLTIGDGLTVDGGDLSGVITETQSNITEGLYYWELYRPDIKKTWVSGELVAINGVPQVDENTNTITINEDGETIQITVNGNSSGTSIQFQDEGVDLGDNRATTVDFVGPGVSGQRTGNKVTYTIPGSTGGVESVSGDLVDNTDPANPIINTPDASQIDVSPAGNLTSTDAQAAFQELQSDIDNLDSEIAGAALDDPTLTQFLTRVAADSGTTENIQFATDKTDQLRYIRIASKLRWLITANAYKANKVYAILPFNSGNGDPSFTRTSVANRIKLDGTLEALASGVPQIDYRYGNEPVILVEPACVNLLTNPAAPATQNVAVTAQPYTLSFYGTGTITLSGAATGSLVGTGANTRVILTFTPSAGTLTLTVSGSVVNAQLEARNHATSEAIAATRTAGTITVSDIFTKGFIGNGQGTFYFRVKDNTSKIRGGSGNILGILDSVTGDALGVSRSSAGSRLQVRKTVASTNTTLYTTLTDEVAVAIVWSGALASVFVNGVKVVTDTVITSVNYATLSITGTQGAVAIKEAWLSPYALSDNELIDATNLDGVANRNILETVLTGLDTSDDSDVLSSDNVIDAFGKLQARNTNQDERLDRIIYPEDYGAVGNGTTDDYVALNDWASAVNAGAYGKMQYKTYATTQPIVFEAAANVDCQGGVIKAVSTFTGNEVVRLELNAQTKINLRLCVDANSLGIDGVYIADAQALDENFLYLHAKNANDGIKIKGNVEGLNIYAYPVNCLDGVTVDESDDNLSTPDELFIYLNGRNNRTHFSVRGSEKSSGQVIFNCAQSEIDNFSSVIIETGWWILSGQLRGIKGGVEITGTTQLVQFNGLMLNAKGDETDTNPALMVDAPLCYLQGDILMTAWNDKVWIKRCAGGNLHTGLRDADGSGGYGIKLGDAANAKECQGMFISGATGGDTFLLELDNAESCHVNLEKVTSTNTILVSSTSEKNRITLNRFIRAKTITNNRTQNDNLFIYQGVYSNAELEQINGGTFFKGMEVEGSADTSVYGRLFWNGTNWESANGLTYNTGTNTWS